MRQGDEAEAGREAGALVRYSTVSTTYLRSSLMYYLFVAGVGWEPDRDTVPVARFLEYTDQDLLDIYKPDRILDVDSLPLDIPAIFMTETGNQGDQLARVGEVTRFRRVGTDLQFDYTLDRSIPPLSNQEVQELAGQLDIERFEFTRTHVALKDRDLFRILFKRQQANRPGPKVFQLPEGVPENDLVSVMMPFDAAFTPVYQALTNAVAPLGMRVQRADNIWDHDAVIQDIVSLIAR